MTSQKPRRPRPTAVVEATQASNDASTAGGIQQGQILRIVHDKGFGFLRGADKQEYFFHRSACVEETWSDAQALISAQEPVPVTFRAVVPQPAKGPRAVDVRMSYVSEKEHERRQFV